jgi:hypothetical protein
MSTFPGSGSSNINENWRNHPRLRPNLKAPFTGAGLGIGVCLAFFAIEKVFDTWRAKKQAHHGHKHESHEHSHEESGHHDEHTEKH